MRFKKWLFIVLLLLFCGFLYASEESGAAEHSSSVSVFSGWLGESIWTLLWFVLVMLVLKRFAWKPILAGLQGREEHIENQVKKAEETRKKAEAILTEYQQKLMDARSEGEKIVSAKVKDAQKQADAVVAKTQQEIQLMREKAEADIERAKSEAREELKSQAGKMVIELSEQVLARSIDQVDNERFINDAIGRLNLENNQG